MKAKIYLILFFCALNVGAFSQYGAPCSTPMSNPFFQQKLGQVNSTYDANARFGLVSNLVQTNCFTSWQVKQLVSSLANDEQKYEVSKAAYSRITDPMEFYVVYDAFAYFSWTFRLHDYVSSVRGNFNQPIPPIQQQTDLFPILPYPDANQYLGPTACPMPVSEQQFLAIVREMKGGKVNEQSKLDYARSMMNSNCFSTAHIMKLATLLSTEQGKLDLLMAGISRVFDRGNYASAQMVLSSQPAKNTFLAALYNNQPNNPVIPPCTVTQTEMDEIKASINKTSFPSGKVTIAKQAISAKKCFTVNQIKDIIKLFSFDDNKLDLAKFCYDYCIDKSNYYQLNDVFAFSSSKDELSNYVQGRQ